MKTLFGTTFFAVAFLAPGLCAAASLPQSSTITSATTTSAPASSEYAASSNTQHPLAVLDYQDGVHLKPASSVNHDATTLPAPRDSAAALMDETGFGH